MRVEKFKILQYIRELLIMIEKEMINFPKKDIELKNRIRNNAYDILNETQKNMEPKQIEDISDKDFTENN